MPSTPGPAANRALHVVHPEDTDRELRHEEYRTITAALDEIAAALPDEDHRKTLVLALCAVAERHWHGRGIVQRWDRLRDRA